MQTLLLAREGAGDHIRDALTRTIPGIEVVSTMDNLVSRIRHSSLGPFVAVLIAGSKSEFAAILQIKWLLYDTCTILILPDQDIETVTAGHDLCPRFMGCLDDDADAIVAVLSKILKHESAG